MIRPALLAAGVALAASASGSGDYELVVTWPDHLEVSCARDLAVCEAARRAVARSWLPPIPADAATGCAPHPYCFDARSGCIPGYDGPREEGYCR